MPEGVRAWRDIYSAGQSVALIEQVEPVADLAARLTREFERAAPWSNWRERLAEIDRKWRA
jgi:nitronate monooxygenase